MEKGRWRNLKFRQSHLLQAGAVMVFEVVVEDTMDNKLWRAMYLRYNTEDFPGLAQNVIFSEVEAVPSERFVSLTNAKTKVQ